MDKNNKKKNLIIASVVMLILVIVLLVVWLMKGDSPSMGNTIITEPPKPTITIGGNITNVPNISATPSVEPTIEVEPTTVPTIPVAPTIEPTITVAPTVAPTIPVVPTEVPTITVAPTVEPTITVEPTVEPTITVAPTATPSPSPTSTPTPVPTSTPTPKPTSTPTPSPSPTSTPTPKPTATPTPEPTKAPVVSEGNGMMTWGDTVKLDKIGVSIPVLDNFNDKGLTEDGWFGDTETPGYGEKQTVVLDALEDTQEALIDKNIIGLDANGFTLSNSDLTFHYGPWSATGDLELNKNKTGGYYEIVINCNLKEDIYTGKDVAPYSREILVGMLSMISSEPTVLADAIYNTIYDDYVIPKNSWGSVGDCLGYTDYEASYKNHYVFRFKAK